MAKIRIRQERNKVLLLVNGRPPIELPWGAAIEIGKALRKQAIVAREFDRHKLIIQDQSILFATGSPVNITGTDKMHREALKTALDHGGTRNGIDNILRKDKHPKHKTLKGIQSGSKVGHTTLFNVPGTEPKVTE